MAYEIKLDLKQTQQLVMTPQLRDAIAMLQMNNLDLQAHLEQELEHNPFLEQDEKREETDTPEPHENNEVFDAGSSAYQGSGGSMQFNDPINAIENTVAAKGDLRTHLMEQVNVSIKDARDKMIAALLVDRLDESGYLRGSVAEHAQSLGCSEERIEALLKKLRHFDPTGIFANDLTDCLALQLEEREVMSEPFKTLLNNLDKLASADFDILQTQCNVTDGELQDMIALIRTLNPKPSSGFDYTIAQTAIADILMERRAKHEGGGWKVHLNHETLPKVLINQDYVAMIETKSVGKADKKFLNDKLHSANWLVQALDQRAQTILKVATSIIETQEGFFLFGVEYLKPLTLREIAEDIGVHESTVSRITIDKFIGTPRGLFPLKFFFGSGVGSSDGGSDIAASAIKAKIKAMIEAEDKNKILSDDAITKAFKAEGIAIARRTVAKYREAMHIPASSKRRKLKKHT
jgi:RNA polymerase sigma-54 factor